MQLLNNTISRKSNELPERQPCVEHDACSREQDLICRDSGYYNKNPGKRKFLDNKEKGDDDSSFSLSLSSIQNASSIIKTE